MPDFNLDDFMEDSQGRLVHRDNVKPVDKLRDELVRELVKKARALQKAMVEYKLFAMAEVEAFVELSAREYGVALGGKKGNISLPSYDGKLKAAVQISEYLIFNERLQAAKKLIDECLNEWTQGSRSEIRTIINDAFQVDKEGRINTRRILGLRRLDIADDTWKKAMEAIADSLQVAGSKSYLRLYERCGPEGKWEMISLDFAAL